MKKDNKKDEKQQKNDWIKILVISLVLTIIVGFVSYSYFEKNKEEDLPYTEFIEMINKNEIVKYYNSLCLDKGDCLTREKYRNMNPKYKSSLIEKIWGSWTNFIKESKSVTHESRNTLIKTFDKNINDYHYYTGQWEYTTIQGGVNVTPSEDYLYKYSPKGRKSR